MKLNRPPGPRLGELLEKRGRISRDVLLNALRHQRTNGGRIGTCLLELEAIGEDDLLDVLSDQLKVPFAPPEELRSLSEEVVKLLPEKVARQRFSVPFRVSSTHVTVAMRDPTDLLALDEVAFVTGRRIRVQVSSELRILEALAKYYGVELAGRFTKLLDKINRERFLWSQGAPEAPPPELAELPPLHVPQQPPDLRGRDSGAMRVPPSPREAAKPSTSGLHLRPIVSVHESPPPVTAPRPATIPATTVPIALDVAAIAAPPSQLPPASLAPPVAPAAAPTAPRTAPAGVAPALPPPIAVATTAAPPPVPPPPAAAPAALPPDVAPAAATGEPPTATSLAEAEERLAAPAGRDEIGQIVLEFARSRAAAALLLMVRRDEAAGWLGFGPGLDDESVESCRVDLNAPSFVRALRDGASSHRGALAPLPAHAEIRAMLSTNWATDLLALPLRMRERLVGVLVVTLEEGLFAPEVVEELTRLVAKSSVALEVIVLRQKLQAP